MRYVVLSGPGNLSWEEETVDQNSVAVVFLYEELVKDGEYEAILVRK